MLVKRSFIVLIVSVFVMLLALPSMAYAVYTPRPVEGYGDEYPWDLNISCLMAIDESIITYTKGHIDPNDAGVRQLAWRFQDAEISKDFINDYNFDNSNYINFPKQINIFIANDTNLQTLLLDGASSATSYGYVEPSHYCILLGSSGDSQPTGDEPTPVGGGTTPVVGEPTPVGGGNQSVVAGSGSSSNSGGSNNSRARSVSTYSQTPTSSTSSSPGTTSQASSFQQDPFQPLQTGTPGQPTDPNQPQPAPGDQPQPEASTGEAEGIAIADEMVTTALSPVPEEPVSMEQVTAIAAALATSEVVRTGVVALPILLVALFGAFILTGSEDYQPKTKFMKKIMEWRRKRKGEPEKGQPMFDERAYYDNGLSARGKNGRVNALGNGHRLQ